MAVTGCSKRTVSEFVCVCVCVCVSDKRQTNDLQVLSGQNDVLCSRHC